MFWMSFFGNVFDVWGVASKQVDANLGVREGRTDLPLSRNLDAVLSGNGDVPSAFAMFDCRKHFVWVVTKQLRN